ncbi:MAG: hypothetical protein FJ303_08210 [Planctomycetes bacterium]|nr:hypothetical protein [Planctomycetota bacterium]
METTRTPCYGSAYIFRSTLNDHPKSGFAAEAQAKIKDFDDADARAAKAAEDARRAREFEELLDRLSGNSVTVTIQNTTSHRISVSYSGATYRTISVAPFGSGSVNLPPGTYTVSASADSFGSNVRSFSATRTFVRGMDYSESFSTTKTFGYSPYGGYRFP